MNCSDWEERIAFYAGGDLNPVESVAVERHVEECAGCQLLLSGLRESLELLRTVHIEPMDEAHFAAVRARVLSELERGCRPWWRQVWVYPTVVVAMVLLIAVWPPAKKKSVAQESTSVQTSDSAADPLVGAGSPRPVVTGLAGAGRRGRGPRTRGSTLRSNAPNPKSETLVVKLLTDDPDVVIYWITDSKGD